MTYEEYFRHRQEMHKTHSARQLTGQEIDEEISLINQLPCTGGGAPTPLLVGQGVFLDVHALDRGEKFPGQPCPHRIRLAAYQWVKSMHEAKRNGTPLPPMP